MDGSQDYDNNTSSRECFNGYGCAIASCIVTLFSALAIVGNSFNIIVLTTGKFLTKPHVYFLISLAIADLLTGVINLFSIYPSIAHIWPYGEAFCILTHYVREALLEISLLMILCLNLERYIAISYPFRSKIWVTRKRSKILIFLCWFVTFVLKIYLLFDVVFIVEYDDDVYACTAEYDNHKGIAITSSAMMEIPGLLILSITSVKLMMTLNGIDSKRRRRMLADQSSFRRRNSTKSRNLRKKLHGFKVLVVIATVSYITLLPSFTLDIIYIIREDEDEATAMFWALEFAFFWLASCGSFANVFVYFFMDRHFSKCLREMVQKSKKASQRRPAVLSPYGSSEEDSLAMNGNLSVISDNCLNSQDTHLEVKDCEHVVCNA
ncbi:Tachykinin-like peptides receptor 86C [Holothuria leucospilota]|uniref:Tachykinin-like peptides receptor 86C n=1 Tax=Holothuria leucospilota TaxID=206669 RepID=A0A9Q0YJ24_HOLLE|nr:Tachykinin-like peptides receptor 86C [Holothuria leucospilota]